MSLENKSFISTSILEILNEGVDISSNTIKGIEGFALSEYILQSVFLKMTGYQEQKLKCICWDIASIDLDFRYQLLNKMKLSECSSKDDKNTVYHELCNLLKKYDIIDTDTQMCNFLETRKIAEESKNDIVHYCKNSAFEYSMEQNFNSFQSEVFLINAYSELKDKKSIFPQKNDNRHPANNYDISAFYEKGLYRERNRCAHNLKSYQQNLPRLADIRKQAELKYHYFNYFHLLSIIDKIYKELYEKLISVIQLNNW